MDRMKHLFAALLSSLALTASAQAEVAFPRLSPLAVVNVDGVATGESVAVPFGLPLDLLDRTIAGGTIVMVQDATGAAFAVRATDLIAPTAAQAGLVAMAEPGRNNGLRPDMPLWDSAARARLYLQGAASDSLRPAFTEQPGGVFPVQGLPIFAVETAPTSIGHPVMMAGAWVPVMPEALDPSGSAAPRKVVLHVLVDGSDYARDFTLESLQQVSRVVAQGDLIDSFSRQVIYDNGTLRDEGQVAAAGLRAEWPEPDRGTGGTLTDALAAALDNLATSIAPDDGVAHVVLVLVGPGLGTDPLALARVTAAGQKLGDLRGVVLVQGTPEPNPANDMVLRQMAGGTAARFLDFGGDVMGAVEGVMSTAPAGDATTLSAWRDKVCALAAERALPCVIAAPGVLPRVPAADWVALPLWFVMDGAALDLVPAGMAPADARGAQIAIRACHAAGQVWDAAAVACAATAAPLPDDAKALRADLVALQRDLSARLQERDVALNDLSRQTAAWDDQRSTLRAAADQAMANLADAQGELDRRAATITAQEAQLSVQAASVADLTDRAKALAVSVSDLQGQLDTALADAARLGRDLDDRDAALVAARGQVVDLTAIRDAAQADLTRMQGDLAAALAEGDRLANDLTVAKSAQAVADAALTQERADWQAKADATAQALADLTTAQSGLEGQVADLTRQLADTTTARDLSAAQAADLAAAQTALEGQLADLTSQLADMTAARDQSAAQASDLAAAQTALEGQLADLTGQLADQTAARTMAEVALSSAEAAALQAATEADAALRVATEQLLAAQTNFDALVAERDDLTARLSVQISRTDDLEAIKGDLSLAESDIRADHASVTRQLAEAQSKLADLETARTTALAEAATTQAALADAQAKLTEMETARSAALTEAATTQAALADAKARLAELDTDRSAALTEAETTQAALADAQAKLTELDTFRATALAEAATLQAVLTEAQAQGLAVGDRVAALQGERDALVEQVATLQGEAAMIVQGLTDRLAQAEGEVARLNADLAARAMAEETPAPADDAFVQVVNPKARPKARPSANLALAAQEPGLAVNAPPKTAVKVAVAAPVAPQEQPSPSRRVAPASDARQLKGCQFQWVGQEGRLVCP
jgi:hypothetical protein